MWHLKKVPKILHFYWGMNKKMSFLRYTSILSFSKINPDWRVILHLPEFPCKMSPTWDGVEQKGLESKQDYFEKIIYSGISVKKHNFEEYGISNDIHEVFKNDFLRWIILSQYGGVWSDTDIIYTNPIDNLKDNKIENNDADVFLCKYPTGSNAIGFLISSFNNDFFGNIFLISKSVIDVSNYQSIGARLLNTVNQFYPDLSIKFPYLKFVNINNRSVYSIDCNYGNIAKFYIPLFEYEEPEGLVGYHWYGGDPITQIYEANITEDNYYRYDNLMKILIERVYK